MRKIKNKTIIFTTTIKRKRFLLALTGAVGSSLEILMNMTQRLNATSSQTSHCALGQCGQTWKNGGLKKHSFFFIIIIFVFILSPTEIWRYPLWRQLNANKAAKRQMCEIVKRCYADKV